MLKLRGIKWPVGEGAPQLNQELNSGFSIVTTSGVLEKVIHKRSTPVAPRRSGSNYTQRSIATHEREDAFDEPGSKNCGLTA